MSSVKLVGSLAIILTILVSGCLAKAMSAPPSPTKPLSRLAWQDDWDKTVAAAKNEGKLIMYTTVGTEVKTALSKPLKEKFGIDIEYVPGRGAELTQKIFSERRAGLYLGDLYLAGATTQITELKPAGVLAPIKTLLLLPEVVDSKAYFGDKIPFIDKEGMYIIGPVLSVANALAINSDLVKTGDLKGYADLLDPKWKDKIIMNDPSMSGTGGEWFMVTALFTMTPNFHRQLVKQNPMITRDQRLQVEWVGRGKYSIALAPQKVLVAEFQKLGAPIKWVLPVEGLHVTSSQSLACLDQAPHHNAAKVFVNWLMSKEGLAIYSRATLLQSARKDVSTDFLEPDSVRNPNLQYFSYAREEVVLRSEAAMKLAKEIYGPLLK